MRKGSLPTEERAEQGFKRFQTGTVRTRTGTSFPRRGRARTKGWMHD